MTEDPLAKELFNNLKKNPQTSKKSYNAWMFSLGPQNY